jgi:hypothetical protein
MRKDIILPKNPTNQDVEDYYKLSQNYTNFFEKRNYNIGDKIIISDNPCSMACGCYWKNNEHDNFINPNEIYTIKHIHYFGGGCPPTLLEIKELPQTHSYDTAINANIFKVI